ncbi:uncharacterized protein LOC116849913 isoform X2 [Odontomachus brunneus]|uniref:uncharacterized protein LOC116849913 isoform X2 n=1 Tax=Odontomachus brunneus TaxID=486640 RepID=UPI0013F29415|nr:uncharacterized protein LOC116849913 isoform X2 [Odontomachus brunneus]
MDVPLFPTPPARRGVTTPLSDVPDVATLPRAPVSVVSPVRVRDAALEREPTYKGSPCTRKRHRVRRNSIHPRVALVKDAARRRVTEFCVRMSERRAKHDEGDDDDDVVCGIRAPTTISEELAPRLRNGIIRTKWAKSVAVQTIIGLPLRLRVLPSLRDIEEDNGNASNSRTSRFLKYLRFMGRLAFSQFGLLWLLVTWTMAGAAAFCAAEGPREREQVILLKNMQKDLAVGLATELRQLRTEQDQDVEPLWSDKVRQYVAKHEKLLLVAVASGYGESGNSGQLWTFPGCVLFAISLITTLGFGAPVPRTTAGRTVGVIFAAIGIPAHFLLILNFGLMTALRLQRYANAKRNLQLDNTEPDYSMPMPKWVKIVPFVFSAIMVAVLQVSATQSLTNIGLKYGLLIEA